MSDVIDIRFLDMTDVDDRQFKIIEEVVRGYGYTPSFHMEKKVYQKYMIGRWLATELLKTYGVSNEQLKGMAVTNLGKPYILHHTLSFSISHSNNVVICATSYHAVGIDVEYVRPINLMEYKECFSQSEWNSILASPDPNRSILELWTRKESLLKADGRGLQVPLNDVILLGQKGYIRNEERKWHFQQIEIEEYVCHVCTALPIKDVSLERVQF